MTCLILILMRLFVEKRSALSGPFFAYFIYNIYMIFRFCSVQSLVCTGDCLCEKHMRNVYLGGHEQFVYGSIIFLFMSQFLQLCHTLTEILELSVNLKCILHWLGSCD